MKEYNLFISHSWSHSDAHEKLVNLLDGRGHFDFKDYSITRDAPLDVDGTDRALKKAIENQMRSSSVVLVLAGVYASYSKWIKKEIEIAINSFSNPKPIIAIEPWGSEKTSQYVKDNADLIVKWNADSIVKAIRDLV